MRSLVFVICVLGCGSPRAPVTEPRPITKPPVAASTEAPSAELPLHWVGEWTSIAAQVSFAFDIRLAPNGSELGGRILWTLVSAPPEHFLASRVGDSGTEYVRGTWDPVKQELHLTGTSVDSPGFLVTDEYKLHLSADHNSFDGKTRGSKGDWMNEIHGRRAES